MFIVAAGAWTPLLNEHLGCRVPIQPGKGYSLTMPRPAVCPKIPLIFPETRVAVTPFQSGYRLGSTMEFAGYDESIRPERLQLLKDGATGYLREPYCEPVLEEWFGWRPMTYDSLPIIDRSPKYENVMIAAGHNMLGLSMAPATGKLVAETGGGGFAAHRSQALSGEPVLIERSRSGQSTRRNGFKADRINNALESIVHSEERLMPIHDWTRVDAGIFHHFHHGWIEDLSRALNRGLLPPDHYALAEQIAAGLGPDVLTLQRPANGTRVTNAPAEASPWPSHRRGFIFDFAPRRTFTRPKPMRS